MTARRAAVAAWVTLVVAMSTVHGQVATCPGEPALAELVATRGRIRAGASCGAFVIETDAADSGFSYGAVRVRSATAPLELRARVRRLTPDRRRTIELTVPAGMVLLRDGEIGFYVSEAQFEADGWHRLPGLSTYDEHLISVREVGAHVDVAVDGKPAATWRVDGNVGPRDLWIGLKGAPGFRGRMLVRELRVRAIP